MFKALYNHVNNIIEKYLQIYDHILIYLQWIKKVQLKERRVKKARYFNGIYRLF